MTNPQQTKRQPTCLGVRDAPSQPSEVSGFLPKITLSPLFQQRIMLDAVGIGPLLTSPALVGFVIPAHVDRSDNADGGADGHTLAMACGAPIGELSMRERAQKPILDV